MSELEAFINALNSIQTDSHDQLTRKSELTEYLFNGNGWKVITSIYTQKIKVIKKIPLRPHNIFRIEKLVEHF